MNAASESDLIVRLKSEDPHAQSEFCAKYAGLLALTLVPRARNRPDIDVETVAQEALGDALLAIASYEERTEGSFQGWLVAIARNKLLKIIERTRPLTTGVDFELFEDRRNAGAR